MCGFCFIVVIFGCLVDYFDYCLFFLEGLEMLVLDEVDCMLDLGFVKELCCIYNVVKYCCC